MSRSQMSVRVKDWRRWREERLPREVVEAEGRMVVMEEEGRRGLGASKACGRRVVRLLWTMRNGEHHHLDGRRAKKIEKTYEGPASTTLSAPELHLLREYPPNTSSCVLSTSLGTLCLDSATSFACIAFRKVTLSRSASSWSSKSRQRCSSPLSSPDDDDERS